MHAHLLDPPPSRARRGRGSPRPSTRSSARRWPRRRTRASTPAGSCRGRSRLPRREAASCRPRLVATVATPTPAITTNLPTTAHAADRPRRRSWRRSSSSPRRPDVRLVTLTGLGGTGKTRLVARGRRAAGPASSARRSSSTSRRSRSPGSSARRSRRCWGSRSRPQEPVAQAIARRLANTPALLVLDNFEQVLPAATLVHELLAAAPGLTRARDEPGLAAPPRRARVPGAAARSPGRRRAARGRHPRCSSSSSGRRRSSRASSSTTRTRRRSLRSAAGSTGCRLRSSSPPRA